MSRTKREPETKCKETRTETEGKDFSDRTVREMDAYYKDKNRKHKHRKQELKAKGDIE